MWWRKRTKCARISELKVEPGAVIWDLGGETSKIRMTPSQCIDAAHALIAAARQAEHMKDDAADSDRRRGSEDSEDPPRWR